MKKILMFDDFLINRTDNTKRRFHQPEWQFDRAFYDPMSLGSQGLSVVPAPQGGYLMNYYLVPGVDTPDIDDSLRLGLAYSPDGISFMPCNGANPDVRTASHILGHCSGILPHTMYYDRAESDPAKRYKAVCIPYGRSSAVFVSEAPFLLCSEDALHWSVLNESRLVPGYVDCLVSMLYNPITGRYQATSRRRIGERRICLVESGDLNEWSPPRAILHPMPTDEPTTHYYGMPHFYYASGDMMVGFLWKQTMPFDRIMDGPMSTEYAYSYDGLCWNRTWADAFTGNGYGETGGGGCFVFSMLERDDTLLFYANMFLFEHGGLPKNGHAPTGKPERTILTGILKKDRIVGIESGKGQAEMVTQHLKLRSPQLFINVKAPFSSVHAQISQNGQPVPGYSFDDCLPISGDQLALPLAWRGGTLDRFCTESQWIRLHLRFLPSNV